MQISLFLTTAGDDEFSVMAALREFFDLDFGQARDLVFSTPSQLPPVDTARLDELIKLLETAGATVSTEKPRQQAPEPEQPVRGPERISVPEQPVSEPEEPRNTPEPANTPLSQWEMADVFSQFSGTFGQTPAAKDETAKKTEPVPPTPTTSGPAPKPAQESPSGSYYLKIESCGSNKLMIVKMVKEITGVGLAEAKEYVDRGPLKITFTDSTLDMARDAVSQLAGTDVQFSHNIPFESGNCYVDVTSVGNSKLQIVKIVKEALGIGLAEAKNMVDKGRFTLTFPKSKIKNARWTLDDLQKAGAIARLRE